MGRRVDTHAGFVDTSFLARAARPQFEAGRVNAEAWVRWLGRFGAGRRSPSRLERVYWYSAATEDHRRDSDGELASLRSIGRIPKLTLRPRSSAGAAIDVELAVDLVLLAARDAIDTAVVTSGEADLVPAVERARAEGVRVIVAYPAELSDSISIDLLASANDRVEIDARTTRQLLVAET